MTIDEALSFGAQNLERVSDSAQLDAELLLAGLLHTSRSGLHIRAKRPLDSVVKAHYMSWIEQRSRGIPIAYLLGEKEFWSLSFQVTNATLVPRADTEILVQHCLQALDQNRSTKVLELGTGSGIIAVVLARARPRCEIVATDISACALTIAQANAIKHQCSNIQFICADWFKALKAQNFDLIVSNPPYIEADHACLNDPNLNAEPINALSSGIEGLDALRVIILQASAYLVPDGKLMVEHGYQQGPAVQKLFQQGGFVNVHTYKDYHSLPRVTEGQWRPNGCT
jgi:release factor glutamine methyltransferase